MLLLVKGANVQVGLDIRLIYAFVDFISFMHEAECFIGYLHVATYSFLLSTVN